MRKILFSVSAGKEAGMGHLSRCITLAQEVSKLNVQPEFNTQYLLDSTQVLLQRRGLKRTSNPLENEFGYECVIFDGYKFSVDDLGLWREKATLVVFEDFKLRELGADLTIDANVTRENDEHAPQIGKFSSLISGSRHIIVSDEYSNVPERVAREEGIPPSLLVTLGGSDPKGFTWRVLEHMIPQFHHFKSISVVLGPLFDNQPLKEKYFEARIPNLVFVKSPSSLRSLYLSHDLAIGAGGTSAYERVACGLASLNLVTQENQLRLATNLSMLGLSKMLDARHGKLEEMVPSLLSFDHDQISSIGKLGPSTINGLGAKSLAELIIAKI